MPDPTTAGALVVAANGQPYASSRNLMTVFENDPRCNLWIRYNRFSDRIEVCGQHYADEMGSCIAKWLDETYGIRVWPDKAVHAFLDAARSFYSYDPLVDYLRGVKWDGAPRIDTALARLFGVALPEGVAEAEGAALVTQLSRCFFVSAVARGLSPGCKVDTQIVLVGAQGSGKSTALAALCPRAEWFADSHIDTHNKDRFEVLRSIWIYENSEMDLLKGATLSRLKGYLSSQQDHYRPSYGRVVVDFPRRCVFVGSTNEHEFIEDPTGLRRFWPLRLRPGVRIDPDAVRAERDQLWAEAVVLYDHGVQWHLSKTDERTLADHAESHRIESPWECIIRSVVLGLTMQHAPEGFSLADVLARLDIPTEQWDRVGPRVGRILRKLGYTAHQVRAGGDRVRLYLPADGAVPQVGTAEDDGAFH